MNCIDNIEIPTDYSTLKKKKTKLVLKFTLNLKSLKKKKQQTNLRNPVAKTH